MEYQAVAKYIKISPRKVRLVADAVKELSIDEALVSLESLNNRAADPIRKVLKSAVANATHNGSAQKGDLNIKMINITEGIRYKRYHYAGRGRIRPYVKRTSHINIVLEERKVAPKIVEKKEVKAEKSAQKGVKKNGTKS